MSAPAPANAPASTGSFLSGLFGAKKTNAPKPANAAAPVVGGRRRSRKDRKNRNRSRKDRSRSRKNRNRSRKNRNRE
jgi:hypothetical protein